MPQVLGELLSHEAGGVGSPSTYAALMAACEKAGQWDLALALFDKMSSQVCMSFPCRAQAASVAHARNATGDKQDWAMRVVAEGRSILSSGCKQGLSKDLNVSPRDC